MFQTKDQKQDSIRVPLVGAYNTRTIDNTNTTPTASGIVGIGVVGIAIVGSTTSAYKDQRFINCIPERITNKLTGASRFYCTKRPGFALWSTPSAGNAGNAIHLWETFGGGTVPVMTSFGSTNSVLYKDTTSLDSITGVTTFLDEALIGTTSYLIALSSDSTGWFYANDAGVPTQTFTATTVSGSPTVTAIASTTGMYKGMAITGTGIPASTVILSVDSGTQITLSANATASNVGVTLTRSVLAKITDTDFPGNAGRTLTGRLAFMDGFTFVMDTSGRIYNSDINSITSWTALNYVTAQGSFDNGVGVARYKNQIVAFGSETTEFFFNAGNATGSPLQNQPQATIKLGCIGPNAYCPVEDSIAWVSSSNISGVGVYLLDGYTPKRISIPAIEAGLALVPSTSIWMNAVQMLGKTLLVIATTGTTYVYSLTDDTWHEWSSTETLWHHIVGTSSGTRMVYAVSNSSTGGKVFRINPSSLVYTDDGSAFNMTIQTSPFDADNGLRKRLYRLQLIGDQYSTTNPVTIQWSDDDYQTWSTGRSVDMINGSPYLVGCGSFRRRNFKIVNSSELPLRLEAIEMLINQNMH